MQLSSTYFEGLFSSVMSACFHFRTAIYEHVLPNTLGGWLLLSPASAIVYIKVFVNSLRVCTAEGKFLKIVTSFFSQKCSRYVAVQ